MEFVRLNGVPVPRVYDYSITTQNCVGAEYMIMEKVGGKLLWDWDVLTPQGRDKIIEQIVKMEATLFSIHFPASGSIYYKKDLDAHVKTAEILSPNGSPDFCIGPSAAASWWYQERAEMALDRGPCMWSRCSLTWHIELMRRPDADCRETSKAIGKRELAWANQYAQPRYPADGILREMLDYKKIPPDDHIQTLEKYLQLSD